MIPEFEETVFTYSLRPATPADFGFVSALHRANFKDYVTPIWGWDEAVQDRLLRERFDPAKMEVIQWRGMDVGFLQVETRPDEIFLANIQLLPAYQRRGWGTKIIRDILAEADGAGRSVVLTVLRTNPARLLYERLGFVMSRQDEARYHMRRPPR